MLFRHCLAWSNVDSMNWFRSLGMVHFSGTTTIPPQSQLCHCIGTDESQQVQPRQTAIVARQNKKMGPKANPWALALPLEGIRIRLLPKTSSREALADYETPSINSKYSPSHDICDVLPNDWSYRGIGSVFGANK
jgi:hypothetical protein